jgi:D-amino-acid dehydrogenase
MAALTDHLRESGVEFLWNTEVTGFRTRGKQVEAAVTPSGELAADEFVLAGGSWTARLARELGLRLPLQAGKGYNLTLPSPPGLPAMGSILVEARVAVTPMGDSLRFAGTMELGGLDLSINRRRVDGMVRSIAAYYPEVKPELFRELPVWSGLRPCSPDGLPYIGRPARCSNVTIAAGHAMLGLSLGPVTGQLVANILTGEPPPVDLQPLSPDRYA